MKKKIIIVTLIIIAVVGVIAAILICSNTLQPKEDKVSAHISESIQADEEGSAQGKSSDDENSESGQKSKIELPIIPME